MDNENSTVTVEDEMTVLPLHVIVLSAVPLALLITTTIVGNVCTIIAFTRDVKLRKVTNYYVLNLAIADLLVGVNSLPLYAAYTLMGFYWPFGKIYCKVWCVIDFLVCAESSIMIILISYDKFQMVRKGANYIKSETKRKAIARIVLSWLAAFLLYGPAIIGYDLWRGYSVVEEDDCDVEFNTAFWFTLVTSLIEFLVPLLTVATLNSMIYLHIRKLARILQTTPPNLSKHQQHNNVSKTFKSRRDRRIAKNLSIFVLVYFICWMPYVISTIVIAFCENCVNENFHEFSNWLLWSNSAVNPFLYAFQITRFRMNYKYMLCFARCSKGNSVGMYDGNKSTVNEDLDNSYI